MRDCCAGGTIGIGSGTGFDLEWIGAGIIPETEILDRDSHSARKFEQRRPPRPRRIIKRVLVSKIKMS